MKILGLLKNLLNYFTSFFNGGKNHRHKSPEPMKVICGPGCSLMFVDTTMSEAENG